MNDLRLAIKVLREGANRLEKYAERLENEPSTGHDEAINIIGGTHGSVLKFLGRFIQNEIDQRKW